MANEGVDRDDESGGRRLVATDFLRQSAAVEQRCWEISIALARTTEARVVVDGDELTTWPEGDHLAELVKRHVEVNVLSGSGDLTLQLADWGERLSFIGTRADGCALIDALTDCAGDLEFDVEELDGCPPGTS